MRGAGICFALFRPISASLTIRYLSYCFVSRTCSVDIYIYTPIRGRIRPLHPSNHQSKQAEGSKRDKEQDRQDNMSLQWLWGAGAPTNPTLKGHQLLVIAVAPPAPEWVAKVKAKYADLDVVHVNKNPWSLLVRRSNRPLRPKPSSASSASSSSTLSIITDDDDEDVDIADDIDWSKATVLLTGPLVPAVGQAPNLQLVQLQSAGANYLLDNPLFKDTDVAFSTANGVHGYVAPLPCPPFLCSFYWVAACLVT